MMPPNQKTQKQKEPGIHCPVIDFFQDLNYYNSAMKTKLYLDTSVPSAYYDTSKPLRQLITQKWFENDAHQYDKLMKKRIIL
jgi:hypothetical protein